jgi:hypothetical protein
MESLIEKCHLVFQFLVGHSKHLYYHFSTNNSLDQLFAPGYIEARLFFDEVPCIRLFGLNFDFLGYFCSQLIGFF